MAGESALGEHLMGSFAGTIVPDSFRVRIARRALAGVTLYRALNVESPAQVRQLTQELQVTAVAAGGPPLLIAADQEGGQLIALGDLTTAYPGNMALGAAGDAGLAREVGEAIGRELSAMGVNVNYAPVCDLNTNPANPGVGVRSFGDDPARAAALAAAFVEGMQSQGVAATLKHFPGMGDARVDPHHVLPILDHTPGRLAEVELVPFREGIRAGARLIMTGHVSLPALTQGRDVPATLSGEIVGTLLREQLGFAGVTISDALDMGAITGGEGAAVPGARAMAAGVDLLLLPGESAAQERVEDDLRLAHRSGELDPAMLARARARVEELRRWVEFQDRPDLAVVGSKEHQDLARRASERALTLVRDQMRQIPLRVSPDERIAVIAPRPKDLTPADTSSYVKPTLADALRAFHPRVEEFLTGHPPTKTEIGSLGEKAREFRLVILCTISASLQPEQGELARAVIASGVPVITVALRTPYDLTAYPESGTHICVYSMLPSSMEALARALWGRAPFRGRLPVGIPGLYPRGHGEG